jgi:hypothetical protein
MKNGVMRYLRYPHWRSYCPEKVKKAFVQGTIHRYVSNTSPNAYALLWKTIWIFTMELRLSGYPWRFIYHTYRNIDENWLPLQGGAAKAFKQMWRRLQTVVRIQWEEDGR